jgi:hypothetical protein
VESSAQCEPLSLNSSNKLDTSIYSNIYSYIIIDKATKYSHNPT